MGTSSIRVVQEPVLMPATFIQKAKDRIGVIVGVGTMIGMLIGAVAWSEGNTADQIRDAELIQKGRNEAVHSYIGREMQKTSAKHDYDFYDVRQAQAEEELLELEEDADSGQLTSSQQRKMRRLETQVEDFQTKQDEALERLAEAEADAEE